MPEIAFDHLAVAAARLGEGIDFVEEVLGVRVPLGGKHPIMNTHNAVMRLGEGAYLEIISADPEAGPPERPRWFALDDPAMQARLREDGPFLATWIVRSSDLAQSVRAARVEAGEIKQMSRGSLTWKIAIRPDGSMAMGGALPIMIEWPPGPHPAQRMTDLGVRLAGLTIRSGKPEAAREALAAVGADKLAEVKPARRGQPTLEARLVKPDGSEAVLSGGDIFRNGSAC